MSAVGRFLRRYWFGVAGFVYGASSAAVGAGVLTGSYWVGLAFGVVAYVGCRCEVTP